MSQVNYLQVMCGCGELSEPYEEEPHIIITSGSGGEESQCVFRNWRCKKCGELVIEPEHRK